MRRSGQVFDGYSVFDPGVERPLREVSRAEAIKHFEHHVASVEERIAELQGLVEDEGIRLDGSDLSLDQLDLWFPELIRRHGAENCWPTPEAFSVCNDLGMYLGETIRRRGRDLGWRLDTSHKKSVSYQRPVIGGFSKVKDPKRYCVDYDDMLCRYAVHLAEGGDPRIGRISNSVRERLQFI
jgi:hypothetical protein